ncbi:ATP-binding protein [Nonomuraea sp. NPDC050536]|uniref:ATP-binding protein n=1 Tax=Nonomuraea sp. NPDC050536 TaxID=3364366 RepID=UPI0037C7ED52
MSRISAAVGSARLVTALGTGGVGKTRVALQAARRLQAEGRYPDGVWLAELWALDDPDVLGSAISSAFGLADVSARPDVEVLIEFLADKHLLLVLDTCEHMIGAVRKLVTTLLQAAPGMTILATSRETLNLPDELVIVVPPMSVTRDGEREAEAVELFVSRARDVLPQFELGPHNAAGVARLCRRLEGIPLALELAAVRLRGLSVDQILDLVAQTTDHLAQQSAVDDITDGILPAPQPPAVPPDYPFSGGARHHTLRAAIGWSHQLCEPAERLLWARLSVFAADFDGVAAREACGGDGLLPDEIDDLLDGLVHKSILTVQQNTRTIRYRILDTLREYGAGWLEQLGGTETMRIRHRDYYLRLAQRGEDAWWGPGQVRWWHRMRAENANIRTAIDYSLSHPDQAALGLELVTSLWFLWVACGFSAEGRHYLVRALHANQLPSSARCKALWVEAYLACAQGDIPAAVARAKECRREGAEIGDSDAVIIGTKMLGTAAVLTAQLDKANTLLGLAIRSLRQDPATLEPVLMPAIVELALVHVMQGQAAEALPTLEDCLATCEAAGEQWLRSYAEYVRAMAYRQLGRITEAIESIRASLRIKRHFRDVLGIVLDLEALSQMVITAGLPPETAAQLQGAAMVNWTEYGLPLMGSPFFSDDHDRCAAEIRRLIGEDAYQAALARGKTMSLPDAVAYATGDSADLGTMSDDLAGSTF